MAVEGVRKLRPTDDQRFPFVSLGKGVDRVRELYKIANMHDVAMPTAAKAWGYSEKSSGAAQTISALKMFGLIDDSGIGTSRRIRISDDALKIIRDPRDISPDRDMLVRRAALKPSLHRRIIENFRGALPPSDEVLRAYLLMDLSLRDDAANEFVREFSETMSFAKIGAVDIIPTADGHASGNEERSVSIGDLVQWEIDGILQLPVPRRVGGLTPDGAFVFLEGSSTGVPVREVRVVDSAPDPTDAQGRRNVAPSPIRPGMERAEFPLQEGLAAVELPRSLSEDSYQDLVDWLRLVLRKTRRIAMTGRIPESSLVMPAVECIFDAGGHITTSDLIKRLEEWLQPDGEDLEILENRADTKFSQKVRNLKSHKTLVKAGYATETDDGFDLTEAGRRLVEATRL